MYAFFPFSCIVICMNKTWFLERSLRTSSCDKKLRKDSLCGSVVITASN